MGDRFTLDLDLAGFAVRLDVDAHERTRVEARYGAFARPAADPFVLDVAYAPDRELPQPEGFRYPQPRCTELPDGRISFRRLREDLVVDLAARRASLTVARRPEPIHPSEIPTFESSLRILMSLDLPARSGLLLHAAGAGTPRGAVVFPAFGGGGKTTTARKIPHSQVLSDDQVALAHGPSGWVAHALPFIGLYARPTSPQAHPLRAIALLAKSASPHVERLRPATALARLLTCVVQYRPGSEAHVVALAAKLADETPIYEVAVAVDTPVEPILDELTR